MINVSRFFILDNVKINSWFKIYIYFHVLIECGTTEESLSVSCVAMFALVDLNIPAI